MELLGKVTQEERQQIMDIYHRKTALQELLLIINTQKTLNDDGLSDNLLIDLTNSNKEMAEWWTATAQFYDWTYAPTDSWQINFEDCSVYLIKGQVN